MERLMAQSDCDLEEVTPQCNQWQNPDCNSDLPNLLLSRFVKINVTDVTYSERHTIP